MGGNGPFFGQRIRIERLDTVKTRLWSVSTVCVLDVLWRSLVGSVISVVK